ncbi:hypothetical protein [Anaerofustis stercorihominis]|uniref:hypothetical protein n=1 Tax=Anaerofustis stercorihominis TaxID=214853 RepID=UPI00214CD51F|nr:hypothetical protein [Anaerofustis stercorihominis]MCR2032830.1 hypothetical protein [Anaerofustis stercorihominis]
MKLTIYGMHKCINCRETIELFESKEIHYDFIEITDSTTTMKEFLKYRDNEDLFEEIKRENKIGIPFFIFEDGFKTLDINKAINHLENN